MVGTKKDEGGEVAGRNTKTKSTRRVRCRRLVDINAPNPPKTGYTLFFIENRPSVAAQHPTSPPSELTKLCAEEWRALKPEHKQKYLDRAIELRTEYLKEVEEYKKTDSFKQFKKKFDQSRRNVKSSKGAGNDYRAGDVPIFTNQFLDLNKERETELRTLRKEVVQLEEERDALRRQIDRLHNATTQLMGQTNAHREVNVAVRRRLDNTRAVLVNAFAHMPMPGSGLVPTTDTIDTYMTELHELVMDSPTDSQQFVSNARDIISRLKIPSS